MLDKVENIAVATGYPSIGRFLVRLRFVPCVVSCVSGGRPHGARGTGLHHALRAIGSVRPSTEAVLSVALAGVRRERQRHAASFSLVVGASDVRESNGQQFVRRVRRGDSMDRADHLQ